MEKVAMMEVENGKLKVESFGALSLMDASLRRRKAITP
jgi:hypothetical protein